MNFPATDPLAIPGQPSIAFTDPAGRTVRLDQTWCYRASLHTHQSGGPLGISPELACFLADSEPATADGAAIIAAARLEATL